MLALWAAIGILGGGAPPEPPGPAGGPDYRYGRPKGEDEKDRFRQRLYAELQRHLDGATDAETPKVVAKHVRKAKNIAARGDDAELQRALERAEAEIKAVTRQKLADALAESRMARVQARIAIEQERIRAARERALIDLDDEEVIELLLLH